MNEIIRGSVYMVVKEKRIHKDGYTLVGHYIEDIGPDYCGPVSWLDRYELDDNNMVWDVGATYARKLNPTHYYVIAESKKGAIRKFKNRFSWLTYISTVEPVSNEDAEPILTKPMEHIIF